jgi:hypothetical protein
MMGIGQIIGNPHRTPRLAAADADEWAGDGAVNAGRDLTGLQDL